MSGNKKKIAVMGFPIKHSLSPTIHNYWLKKNNIKDSEMLKTFNCGVGFCLISNKKNIKNIKKIFDKDYQPYQIGFISREKSKVKTFGKLQW